MRVKFNPPEYAYLSQVSFLPKELQALLFSCKQEKEGYFLNISEKHADEIRDRCGEQLQLVGFDESYKLTPEGVILESLVDKLFYG